MTDFSKERKFNSKEEKILEIIGDDSISFSFIDGVTKALAAIDDTFGREYSLVFKSVFIEKSDVPKWKIALDCSISESTFYRYEKDLIEFISNFYSNLDLAEHDNL